MLLSEGSAQGSIEYLGRDVVVLYNHASKSKCLYVTFDHMRPERTHVRPLAHWILEKLGFSQIHIFATRNHWFQTEEMDDALSVIRGHAAGYERRVAWGSSMGGFAAIQFADRLAADAVLACAPQISINPAAVPWDLRFRAAAREIKHFIYDDVTFRSLPDESYIAFDPGQWQDRRNARAIQAAHPHVKSIVIPYSEHVPTMLMLKQSILDMVLLQLAAGPVDLTQVQRTRRRHRAEVAAYRSALDAFTLARADRDARRADVEARGSEQAIEPASHVSRDEDGLDGGGPPEERAIAFMHERRALLDAAQLERLALLRAFTQEQQRSATALNDARKERDAVIEAARAERDAIMAAAQAERDNIAEAARKERDGIINYMGEELNKAIQGIREMATENGELRNQLEQERNANGDRRSLAGLASG